MMQGRAFLDVAKELAAGPTEAHWRSAAGRAYYALFLEGLEALQRWGFGAPPHATAHAFVRLRFLYAADPDVHAVGIALDRLVQLCNQADYRIATAGRFAHPNEALRATADAAAALARLDQVDADAARRTAAIADIRARWP